MRPWTTCIAVGALFAAMPASAAKWQRVTSNTTGSVIYLDVDSMTNTATSVDAWWKSDQSKDATTKTREVKQLMRIICAAHKMARVSTIEYSANDRVSYSHTTPDALLSYEPIVPDTVGATMAKASCFVAGLTPTLDD